MHTKIMTTETSMEVWWGFFNTHSPPPDFVLKNCDKNNPREIYYCMIIPLPKTTLICLQLFIQNYASYVNNYLQCL